MFVGHDFGAMYQSVVFAEDERPIALVMMAPTARWADWFAKYWHISDDDDAYPAALEPYDPVDGAAQGGGPASPAAVRRARPVRPGRVADEIASGGRREREVKSYPVGHDLEDEDAAQRPTRAGSATCSGSAPESEKQAPPRGERRRSDSLRRRDTVAERRPPSGHAGCNGRRDTYPDAGAGHRRLQSSSRRPPHPLPSTIAVCDAPIGIAEAAGSIWVACYFAGTLVRIDPTTRTLLDPAEVGLGAIGVTQAAGSLWVTLHELDQVARVDPETADLITTIDVGDEPEGIAGDDDDDLGDERAGRHGVADRSRYERGRGHGRGRPRAAPRGPRIRLRLGHELRLGHSFTRSIPPRTR